MQAFRERVAAACAEPRANVAQVARRFAVSLSFPNTRIRRQRTSGTVAELPPHPGPAPRLDAAGDQRLLASLVAQPAATLAELSAALLAAGGPRLGCRAGWRATARLGWGRKKSRHATAGQTPRVVALRQALVETLQAADCRRFVFVDETRPNLPSGRRYGRACGGQRLAQAGPLHNGPNGTGIAALPPAGLSVNGAVTGEGFAG